MNISRPKDSILGVTISGRSLHAVLIQDGPDGPEVIRRFARQLASSSVGADVELPGTMNEALDDDSPVGDFTIQFGNGGSSGSELFLSSEFQGVEGATSNDDGGGTVAAPLETFDMEVSDILTECAEAGFPDPFVAFCVSSSHVTSVELQIAQEAGSKKKQESDDDKIDAGVLIELLSAQLDSEIDQERVAFLPMTRSDGGMRRRLAILAKNADPVAGTLMAMRDRKVRMPAVRLMDSEVSVYFGMARAAYYLSAADHQVHSEDEDPDGYAPTPSPADMGPRKTLVVRAGSEDTLVMFLQDDELLHYESLRSITTYDAPETICSRVLLLQDEYGVGDVQHVLLLSDDREDAIVESFKMFFSDTKVESIRRYLPKFESDGQETASPSNAALAVAVALRLVNDELYQGAFEDVNLLPKKLLRRRIKLPVTWHVFALYGALFITVVFFVGRFFTVESEIRARKYKVEQFSKEVAYADPLVLQARVDSIKAITRGYRRALDVLDSLLIGSDVWSRSLEMTNREAAVVKGIWVDRWRPDEGNVVILTGNATSRDRIVSLAERLDGQINELTFSEIREAPVYTFEMRVPLKVELPEAARYLREQVALENEEEGEAPTSVVSSN
ncbi:MAG: hypothetical protein R3178_03760 [Rhodothermales bacterium]|nr:hypothetical protein [Rhodothermales bacterium]